jgi:peptide/nickel transport system substrate-binding protein
VGRPQTLNPLLESGSAVTELAPLLYHSLLQVDPHTAALQPGLAQAWDYSANGRQVTFRLPPDLRWSDGAPLTAADVADSLLATQHPALTAFSQINAPSPTTLRLTFQAIDCAAVTTVARLPLLRAAQITATVPTGSGPFVAREWAADTRRLSLEPNPHAAASPRLQGVSVRFLEVGELEVALSEGYFDAVGPLDRAPNAPGLVDMAFPGANVLHVTVNYAPKNGDPLPPQVRSALPLALDRAAILRAALAGDGVLAGGPLPPGHWAATAGLAPPPYDVAAARRQLAQAGLRDTNGDGWLDINGKRLELGLSVNGENALHQNVGWLVSSYYRDLGLLVRAETVPADNLLDNLFTHDFNLAIFGWPTLPDPDGRQFWHSTQNTVGEGLNFTGYSNPQVDALLEEAVAVPGCAPGNRAKPYAQIQQILVDDRPVDFLLIANRHILRVDRLRGVAPGPFAPFTWNAAEWYLAAE